MRLERNARFLPGDQYRQLVENLRRDGALTSAPLIYCPEERPSWSVSWPDHTVLSGNHRVEGAIEAGIDEADCIEVLSPIDEQRAIAIQLSHNSIVGQDDPNVLAELYADLSIDWKQYSGLDDAIAKGLKEIDVASLAVKSPQYEELNILFLPEQVEAFKEALAIIAKRAKKGEAVLVGHRGDFDRFFESIIAVKKLKGVHNSAVALNCMAELALQKCAELEAKADGGEEPSGG